MHHKRIGMVVVTSMFVGACASSPKVVTAGGEVSQPAATPANARTLPSGTMMDVTLDQQLGTQTSHTGDRFSATVVNSVIAQNGRTTVPAGAKVWGHVSGATPASNATQTAALVLDFDSLTFNGRSYPFEANITATNLEKQGGSTTSETVVRDAELATSITSPVTSRPLARNSVRRGGVRFAARRSRETFTARASTSTGSRATSAGSSAGSITAPSRASRARAARGT